MKPLQKPDLQALFFPPRLIAQLKQIRHYPLTVLEAPSGFGKTTALDHLLKTPSFSGCRIFRRTVAEAGQTALWDTFCKMLSRLDALCTDALRQKGIPEPETLDDLTETLQEIECTEETYLILDHVNVAEDIGLFLHVFSRHQNPKLHILLLAQQLPEKTSGQFLMNHQILYLNASDFTFTEADTSLYLNAAGIQLLPGEAQKLYQMTGGWIFAMYLQLLCYTRNGRFEPGILNHLIETAFFARLSPEQKQFYLALSVFQSFTVPQASFVTGEPAERVKSQLNLQGFICREENVYRFHSLFSAYLSAVLSERPKEEQNRLYEKGGDWAREHGSQLEALRLYQKAHAYEKLFSMPYTSYDLTDIEDPETRELILDILDHVPEDVKKRYPGSMVPLAFILFFINEYERLGAIIPEIAVLTEQSSESQEQKNAILGELELLSSFLKYNQIDEMSKHHRKAYELLGHKASLINLRSTWTFGSPSVLLLYHRSAGKLSEECVQMDECMPVYYALTGGHGMGAEYMMRAEADFMRGHFDRAEMNAYRAMFSARDKQQNSIYQCGLFLLANQALYRGDMAALSDAIFQMSEQSSQNAEDLCRYTLDLFLGFLYAYTGRCEKIAPWLLGGEISEGQIALMTMPFAHMIYARVLLEKKEYTKLLAFCPYAGEIAEIFPNLLAQIYLWIDLAIAYHALNRPEEAAKYLQLALDSALPDQIYMPFAQSYAELKAILPPDTAPEIVRLGKEFTKNTAMMKSGKNQLSPREREVASLIRMGLTNKQIAARLYISISTVKLTISNIFEKTGIKSRVQLSDAELTD